ncbi:MAG: tetratricopeptide repeat protein [Gammaproteobacteria bacterium]|nr:tetratricopeptide repeat protein [Gammaproteobacteria bacterium]
MQFALQNTANAGAHYEEALVLEPEHAEALIGLAMVSADQGDRAGAERFLDFAAEKNPDVSAVWLVRGRLLQADRNYIEAAQAFRKALQLQSEATPLAEKFSSKVGLVSSLIDSKEFDAAGAQLDELRTRFPDHPVSGFLRGRLAFAKGDYDLAQMALQDYLSKNAGDARGRALLGAINFSQDNLRQAESHLIAAVRANAGGDATRRLLAETRLRLDDPDGALEILLSPDYLSETDAMYFSMLGRAKLVTGDDEAALEFFRKGVEKDPGNDAVTLALATAYLRVDRVGQAVDVLESMPIRAGSDLRRQTLLIAALVRQGDNERAIAESERLLADNPADPSAHVIAGILWQSIGESDRAEAEYDRALSLDPENLTAQFSLSRIALANGETTAAAMRLQSLLEAHPAYVPAIITLGMIFQDVGSLDNLRPYVVRAMESTPESITPHLVLVRLELALGQPDAALAAVDVAQSRFSSNSDLDHLRGLGLLAKGEFQGALRALMSAAAASPGNAVFQFDLAQAQLANKYFGAAADSADAFCKLLPGDMRCPILRGDISLAGGDGGAALTAFEEASKVSWNRQVAMRLARARVVAGVGRASQPLETWLKDHPQDHEVRSMYARIIESEGNIAEAVAEYESLLRAGELDAVSMNNLAWRYALANDPRAVELAERAHEIMPTNGSITDTLGWILAGQGDFERAVPLLRDAVRQSPGIAEIRFHLASALASSGEISEARSILDELLSSEQSFASRAEAVRLSESL